MKDVRQLTGLEGKRVLVRIDTDVDISHGHVADDYRLRCAVPTIQYLASQGASITLIGHLGRPEGMVDDALRLEPVAKQLAQLLVPGSHATTQLADDTQPIASSVLRTRYQLARNIVLLENLRFDPGEETNDGAFAAQLAEDHDYFVNEAFATCHREAASTVGITEKLPGYAGLRLIDELAHLNILKTSPKRPYTLIVGGAKLEEKLGLLEHLLPQVDQVLVGGVVANIFLAATGIDVKKSKVDTGFQNLAEQLLDSPMDKLVLPTDFVWDRDQIVDIGPKTIEAYTTILNESETIFWAGSLGKAEEDRFAKGTKQIAEVLVRHDGVRIAGGGDTITALTKMGLRDKLTFASTGGGAALEYLAGNTLPGLSALG